MKTIKVLTMGFMLLWAASAGAQQTWNIGTPVATDVTATLVDSTLTIRGTGKMEDRTNLSSRWGSVKTLKYVEIAEGVTSIGNNAFRDCSSIISVTIHGNDAMIGHIKLPGSITKIGEAAFRGCTNITSITFPKGLKTIGDAAFRSCSLTSMTLSSTVDTIGYNGTFMDNKLTSVFIPGTLGYIGNETFSDNPITKLVFECGEKPLLVDGGNFFKRCPLDTVFMGRNIVNNHYSSPNDMSIKLTATKSLTFGECVSFIEDTRYDSLDIDRVFCLSVVPPQLLSGNPLRNMTNIRTIVVPYGAGEAYRATPIWQDFNIVELPAPEEITEVPTEDGTFIEWQANEYATGYRLVIFADEAHTDTVRIVEFNAAGEAVNTINFRGAGANISYEAKGLNSDTNYYYTLETLGALGVVLSSQADDFTTLGSGTDIGNAGVENIRPLPVAYYNITGQQLTQIPEKDVYIILYDNGTAEKRMRR